MAIDKNNSSAMNNLGKYYDSIEKNYGEAIKYYKMAIDKNNSGAMNNLGYYYENIEKNYGEAIKYYKMAVENKCSRAIPKLRNLEKKIMIELFKNISSLKLVKSNSNVCIICKNEYNITISFNCKNKHKDHNYCQGCLIRWYEKNPIRCLLCMDDVVLENLCLITK
jgi:TPR repeat protein